MLNGLPALGLEETFSPAIYAQLMNTNYPMIHDEWGTRPAIRESRGEWGEKVIQGSLPDSGDRVSLSSSAGEFGGEEIRGTIGGEHVDVYISRDEWGNREISGSGADAYRRLNPDPPSSTDWM